MTTLVHLDAALFPQAGSDSDDVVKIRFADNMSNDLSTMASSLQMLNAAAAVSTEVKIQMLHPDWTQKQIAEEIERVKNETGQWMNDAMAEMGDFEPLPQQNPAEQQVADDSQQVDNGQELESGEA